MATTSEKIDDLARIVTQLVERVNTAERELERLTTGAEKLRTTDEDLRLRVHKAELEITELKKSREEWGRRLWALVGPLLGLVVGYLLKR